MKTWIESYFHQLACPPGSVGSWQFHSSCWHRVDRRFWNPWNSSRPRSSSGMTLVSTCSLWNPTWRTRRTSLWPETRSFPTGGACNLCASICFEPASAFFIVPASYWFTNHDASTRVPPFASHFFDCRAAVATNLPFHKWTPAMTYSSEEWERAPADIRWASHYPWGKVHFWPACPSCRCCQRWLCPRERPCSRADWSIVRPLTLGVRTSSCAPRIDSAWYLCRSAPKWHSHAPSHTRLGARFSWESFRPTGPVHSFCQRFALLSACYC